MPYSPSPTARDDQGRLIVMSPVLRTSAGGPGASAAVHDRTAMPVALVDGCVTFRRGLLHALEDMGDLAVVCECDTGACALDLFARANPDVAVIAVDLPDEDGIAVCRRLLARWADLRVLVLSQYDWDVYLAAALAARAQGFLLRRAPTGDLVRAIRDASHHPLFTLKQLERVGNWNESIGKLLVSLSPRQWDVLWLVVAGMSNRDIAATLTLSENTVEKHVGAVLVKLGATSRAGLLSLVLEHHLEVLSPLGGQFAGSDRLVQAWWLQPEPPASGRKALVSGQRQRG
jgi:DNA-binding NarL/FixJ family response regulator